MSSGAGNFNDRDAGIQRRTTVLFGTGILGTILLILTWQGLFAIAGGWILLPIVFLGPVLYVREGIWHSILKE